MFRVSIAERQSRQHQLLGSDKRSDPNLGFNLIGHLLEHSGKLCVVVVLEVEPVGEVEEGERGRGQEQQERRGVHSASGGCRLLEAREAPTSPPAGGGGGGGGGRQEGEGVGATGDDVSMGPQTRQQIYM